MSVSSPLESGGGAGEWNLMWFVIAKALGFVSVSNVTGKIKEKRNVVKGTGSLYTIGRDKCEVNGRHVNVLETSRSSKLLYVGMTLIDWLLGCENFRENASLSLTSWCRVIFHVGDQPRTCTKSVLLALVHTRVMTRYGRMHL